jgi:cytochrome c oxidase assembly factor CtaG
MVLAVLSTIAYDFASGTPNGDWPHAKVDFWLRGLIFIFIALRATNLAKTRAMFLEKSEHFRRAVYAVAIHQI